MRLHAAAALVFCLLFVATPLRAVDWPPAIERYEMLALQKPKSGAAMWQMWRYAVATGRMEELKARWEDKSAQPEGHKYRLLLAFLAMLEENFDTARAQYTKAIEAAPNDPAAWSLRGQLEAARKLPEARASLEKAVELEGHSGSNSAASYLGAWLLANDKVDEARVVLDRGVAAAHNHESWLSFTVCRAKAALAQGRLQELITQVEAAPPGPLGGSEMAEIYHLMWDYGQTNAEIERARKLRPDDVLLRRQALQMARFSGRESEVARLLREEINRSPSPGKWREYFHAILKSRNSDEARVVLSQQGEVLFSDPGEWWAEVTTLWQLDLASQAAEVLAAKAREGNWEAALLRAQLLLTEKKWEPAREALWSILDPAREAQPFVANFHDWPGGLPRYPQSASITGALTADRSLRIAKHQCAPPPAFGRGVSFETGGMGPVDSLQDARDVAVLYLAMTAAETRTVPAFITELTTRIAGWPRAERLFAWTIVGNPARTVEELAGISDKPRDKTLDHFCGNLLSTLRALPLEPELAQRAAGLAGKFPRADPPPGPVWVTPGSPSGFYAAMQEFRQGKLDQAWKRFEEGAAVARARDHNSAEQEITSYASFMANGLSELRGGAAQVAEGAAMAMRAGYPESRQRYWGGHVYWTLEAMFPTVHPVARGATNPAGGNAPQPGGHPKLCPPATLFARETTQLLAKVFDLAQSASGSNSASSPSLPGEPVWPLLKKRLDAQAIELKGDGAFFACAAAAYFAWWNQDYDDALARMRRLLAETNDPGVCLGLAIMLRDRGDAVAANKVLADAVPPAPASARFIKVCRLQLAADIGDRSTANALAAEIAEAPWDVGELDGLVRALERAGSTVALAVLRARYRAAGLREEDDRAMSMVMQEAPTAETRAGITRLAKQVLAPPPPIYVGARREAVEALQKTGELPAYAAQLSRDCEAAPNSVEAWCRLAEVSSGPEAMAAWRKVLALQPDNLRAVLELYGAAPAGSEEQARMAAKVLVGNPSEVGYLSLDQAISNFQKAGQLPLLAKCISEAPAWRAVAWCLVDQKNRCWTQLVNAVAAAGDRDSTTLLLRKALEVLTPVPADLSRRSIDNEVALGHPDEAGRQLVEYLAADSTLPLIFAWSAAPRNSSSRPAFNAELLKLVPMVKIAPELYPRLAQAAARDTTARAISFLVRVKSRDATVLPEVDALAGRLAPRTADLNWTQSLATELATWPEAAESCRKLLVAYDTAMEPWSPYSIMKRLEIVCSLASAGAKDEANKKVRALLEAARNPRPENQRALREIAGFALTANDGELLTECCRILMEWLNNQNSNFYVDTGGALQILGALLDAGRATEARQILSALRNYARLKNRSDLGASLDAIEADEELRRGEWQRATPIAWIDADRTTKEQTALAWDLGLPGNRNGRDKPVIVRGESVSALEGRLSVELFFGEDDESMQSFARLAEVGSRGRWEGRLPGPTGFIRAVISKGDSVLIGKAFAIHASANLLHEGSPEKFVPKPSQGTVATLKGGPTIDGEYVSIRPIDSTANPAGPLAVGPRAPVKPKCDYVVSGWVRTVGTRTTTLGWRCLDSAGKVIGSGHLSITSPNQRFWTRGTQRLSWPRNGAEGERLPVGAVFLELIIEGAGAIDLAGLSLVEIPVQPSAPEP